MSHIISSTTIILLLIQYAKVTHPATNNSSRTCLTTRQQTVKCEVENVILFKCHTKSFKLELENLRQWKRRRRVRNLLVNKNERRLKRDSLDHELDVKLFNVNSVVSTTTVHAPISISTSASLVGLFKSRWPVKQWRQYGFTDDYLILINPHWLQFPPPHNAVNYSLGGLYIVMMIIGCSGNGLVLLMYMRCRTLRTPGNILVANLALSDFFMLAKTPVFIFNSFNLGPALGKTGCIIYGFLGGLTGCTSIATLAAIALDRYWAIARPLEGLGTLTALRAKILAIGSWFYAGIFACIPALDIGFGRYVPEGYLTSCSFDYLSDEFKPRLFIFVFFCIAWVTPFATITFCYVNILRVVLCNRLVSSTSGNDHRLSSRHVKEQAKKKAEMKLAILVIAVIALFFVSWTPYAIVALLGIFGNKHLITPTSSMIPALFCKTAACVNPFVYIITHPRFRKEMKKMIFRDKSRRQDGTFKLGYTTDATTYHRPSKDSSETDVEVVEMKDIPCQKNDGNKRREENAVTTVSSKVTERQDSSTNISMKSLEEGVVLPPSWFTKPNFSKKKSFHRKSTKSVVSCDMDRVL